MTDLENRILFYLIEPEGCWHEWERKTYPMMIGFDLRNLFKPIDEPTYVCKICGNKIYCRDAPPNANFTLPEYRIKLQEWLFAPTNYLFWDFFSYWVLHEVNEDMSPKEIRKEYIPDLFNRLSQFILDFLHIPEAQERFGLMICPNCQKAGYVSKESNSIMEPYSKCTVCNGTGKIKAPWFQAMGRITLKKHNLKNKC